MKKNEGVTPQTCPGINKFVRPVMAYVKCHVCGGSVEIWSDEKQSVCDACGAEWHRPKEDASCLEYCEYADQCREIIQAQTRK